jgi:predicted transcriptional regulator of viral defense system
LHFLIAYKEYWYHTHAMQKQTLSSQVIELARKNGVLKSSDLTPLRIPRAYLSRMVQTGQLEKAQRGIYQLPNQPNSENSGMEIVAAKVPKAVFSLFTALQFHELTTQLPKKIWITLPQGSHPPKMVYPPIKMIQCNPSTFEEGVEIHRSGQKELRVYSVARTVVDCFQHRNKIGLDVAVEALRDALHKKKVSVDELWRFAKTARVTNIIRPYIEALT